MFGCHQVFRIWPQIGLTHISLIFAGCICQPLNTVVLEKQNSSLLCKTDNRYNNVMFFWRYGYAGNSDVIYAGQHVSSKYNKSFTVKKEGSQCELHISHVRLSHAGLYECEIFSVIPNVRKTSAAHFVVLGKYNYFPSNSFCPIHFETKTLLENISVHGLNNYIH